MASKTFTSSIVAAELAALGYFKTRKYLRTFPNAYPRFLYKYISSEIPDDYLSDYLTESNFWLSSPAAFNDPFDTSAQVLNEGNASQKRKRWMDISIKNAPELTKIQRELEVSRLMSGKSNTAENITKIFRKNAEKVGLSCFNETPRNILMWSHYANKHKGIVLQFEIAKNTETMLHAVKVNYSNEYPTLNFAQEMSGQLAKIMLRKSKDWEYEKEWRLLVINAASTYIKFKPEALTGIIFGCRTDEKTRARIEKFLSNRQDKNLPIPKLYQAKQHQSQFKIVIERVK